VNSDTALMFVERVPEVVAVPNSYVVPDITVNPSALPVLAANVDDTIGLTAFIVVLYGPAVEQEVGTGSSPVPPRPFAVKAIVGEVPVQAAVRVTATDMLELLA
jgi:hypothetical protein